MRGRGCVFLVGVLAALGCASTAAAPGEVAAREEPKGFDLGCFAEEAPEGWSLSGGRDVDGVYGFEHTIRVLNGDDENPGWEKVTVADTLVVELGPGGALSFQLDTAATNGHTCHMEGSMVPRERYVWKFQDPEVEPDGNGPCQSTIEITEEEIRYEASTACKLAYCGMRATLGKRVFLRSTKDKFEAPADR